MATARLSPAANLLRSSRLFSIPPALTPPASLVSDTATQSYPTHAAIETPPSSWDRGDWGFKRSLPLKSTTKTGTTTIRVQNGIDSIEHITDFDSAADHVLTLQKWKELNLAIRFVKKRTQDESTSVFEQQVDNISSSASPGHRRWRYTGPWLAGQTGWEFDALLKRVAERKSEFREYLRARLNADRSMSRRQEAIDAGADLNRGQAVEVTDEEFAEHMRDLRATPTTFGPLIAEFLDLPEGPGSTASTATSDMEFTYGRTTLAAEAYKENGPPKTHPSAGLSYYRSGAHVSNHPVFGPQQLNPPVVARVLRPNIRRRQGNIGVAGFVASGGVVSALLPADRKPNIAGGQKLVLRPETAAVDSEGKVMLSVGRAQADSQRVYGLAEVRQGGEQSQTTKTKLPTIRQLDDRSVKLGKPDEETKFFLGQLEQTLRISADREHI